MIFIQHSNETGNRNATETSKKILEDWVEQLQLEWGNRNAILTQFTAELNKKKTQSPGN